MADEDLTKTTSSEADGAVAETREIDEVRRIVGDVYTFVRSREINKTFSSFTFDHYIEERKIAIKGQRILRTAANPGDGVGKRPSQLDAISKLEEDFNRVFETAKKLAEIASQKKVTV